MRYALFLTTTVLGSVIAPKVLLDLVLAIFMTSYVAPWALRRKPVAPRTVRSRLARLRQVESALQNVHASSINFTLACVR